MSSNAFGAKGPKKPHLVRGSGGVQAEIQDLRSDVEEGFQYTENQAFQRGIHPEDVVNTNLVWDNATRTFTIEASGSGYRTIVEGVEYIKTSDESIVVPDEEGPHFIFFGAGGVLQTLPAFDLRILTKWSFLMEIYWDATNKYGVVLANERHTQVINGWEHFAQHSTLRSVLDRRNPNKIFGLTPGAGAPGGAGTVNSHAQFSIAHGLIWDEDILNDSEDRAQQLTPIAQIPILYLEGDENDPSWRTKLPDDFPLIQNGALGPDSPGPTQVIFDSSGGNGLVAYNQNNGGTWQLTEVNNNDYVIVHYFASNDIRYGVVGILGQATYLTTNAAEAGAEEELKTITLVKLPTLEWVWLYSMIFQSGTTKTNDAAASIETTAAGDAAIDWRDQPPRTAG